jgi:hypothetical protein
MYKKEKGMPLTDFLETTWHFSSKMTNSNAAPCTVRVGKDKRLDMPYVSARTTVNELNIFVSSPNRQVSSDNFLLDMMNGIDPKLRQEAKAKAAEKVLKEQQKLSEDGVVSVVIAKKDSTKVDYYADLSDADRSELDTVGNTTHVNWNGEVSTRVKQILLPFNTAYTGCIPLMSYGLMRGAVVANDSIAAHLKSLEEVKPDSRYVRPLTTLPYTVGGSKPQNVGFNLDSKYLRLIVTGFKRRYSDMSLRASVLHNRMRYKLKTDYDVLDKYAGFISECSWSKYEIPAHTGYVARIINSYFNQANEFKAVLEPEDMLDITDRLTLGFLDDTRRSPDWYTMVVQFFMQKLKASFIRKYGTSDKIFNERFVRNIAEEIVAEQNSKRKS